MATIDRPEQPECIVLEASGVAEPSGIAVTFITESGFVASELPRACAL
jgi:G3E family GTPase